MSIGLSSHNSKLQVANDIPTHGQIIDNTNLKSQFYIDRISEWTEKQRMTISEEKSKTMIVNFSKKHQFTTRLKLKKKNIEVVESMKILGKIITSKLDWNKNTKTLVSRVNKQMAFIRKMHSFGASQNEMVHLWITYCRSVLEQSAVVWQANLTQENRDDLERYQKSFAKLILKRKYITYEQAIEHLNLPKLEFRRKSLFLKFAQSCLANEKMRHLFPLNRKTHKYNLRTIQKYYVQNSNTQRLRKSPVIYMQNLLNENQ